MQQHFEVILREDMEREQLTGIARDGRDHGLASMDEFVSLVSRINASSSHLGKDDKFQLFVCLAARLVNFWLPVLDLLSLSLSMSCNKHTIFLCVK